MPKDLDGPGRIIGERPIYDLEAAQELVRLHSVVVLNDQTLDGYDEAGAALLPPPDWSDEEFAAVVLALEHNGYRNSQWCKLSTGRYLDCDSYTIYYGRARRAKWDRGLKIYVKFGFVPNLATPQPVICRIHTSAY